MNTPDDISTLPLTREEMVLGMKDHLDALLSFFHKYRKLLPWDEMPELEALEGAAQDMDYALEYDPDDDE